MTFKVFFRTFCLCSSPFMNMLSFGFSLLGRSRTGDWSSGKTKSEPDQERGRAGGDNKWAGKLIRFTSKIIFEVKKINLKNFITLMRLRRRSKCGSQKYCYNSFWLKKSNIRIFYICNLREGREGEGGRLQTRLDQALKLKPELPPIWT